MLINFKTSNYKSFAEEMTFSMIPAPRLSDLKYSVFNETIGKKQYKTLCSRKDQCYRGDGYVQINIDSRAYKE